VGRGAELCTVCSTWGRAAPRGVDKVGRAHRNYNVPAQEAHGTIPRAYSPDLILWIKSVTCS
jgi:hypothetical protein